MPCLSKDDRVGFVPLFANKGCKSCFAYVLPQVIVDVGFPHAGMFGMGGVLLSVVDFLGILTRVLLQGSASCVATQTTILSQRCSFDRCISCRYTIAIRSRLVRAQATNKIPFGNIRCTYSLGPSFIAWRGDMALLFAPSASPFCLSPYADVLVYLLFYGSY